MDQIITSALLESVKDEKDHEIEDLIAASHMVAVESRQVGLAATVDPSGGHLRQTPVQKQWVRFVGRSAKDVACLLLSADPFESSIGLASVTSLYDYSNMEFIKAKAQDILVEKGKGKKVAVIGHFPFVNKLRHRFEKLWVIELQPKPGDLSVQQGFSVLPECDVIAITASTIINKTLKGILDHCKADSYKLLLGPSTPLCEVLFDFGINLLCGSRVADKSKVFKGIKEGLSFRQLSGVEPVCLAKN